MFNSRCRPGGVPGPLAQPERQGSSTDISKKEKRWLEITARRHVSLLLCGLGEKNKLTKKKKTTILVLQVCSHLNDSRGLRQIEALLFTRPPDTVFPAVHRHFIIRSVSVSREPSATPVTASACQGWLDPGICTGCWWLLWRWCSLMGARPCAGFFW